MWQVAVYRPGQHQQFQAVEERFVLSRNFDDGRWTFHLGDSRPLGPMALRLRVDGKKLWIESRGVDGPIQLASGENLRANSLASAPCPCVFQIGDAWFEVRLAAATPDDLSLAPLRRDSLESLRPTHALLGPDAETVAHWLSAVSRLHRTAANAPQFLTRAAELTLDATGLDAVMVLLRSDDAWQIAGSALPQPQHGLCYEPAALAGLVQRPETWRSPTPTAGEHASAGRGLPRDAVVVSPVLDDGGQLVGALYGVRHDRGDNRRRGVRPLEARVVETMAEAVAAGLARRQQEIESARQTVLLEQAFSPAVAAHLRAHPEALAGQTRLATLLFADLRGFTAIAQRITPKAAYDFLAELMELLTQAVMDRHGVVIDYYGDGVSALWNAPLDVPDQADQACAAALAMLDALPTFSRQWAGVVGQPLELGIGVHLGEVQVGNAGSHRRLKYGPRGAAVNLASRVQAATRQLDVPLLITDAVRRRLSPQFVALKACTAQLPGVDQPMELFTVLPATDARRIHDALERYARALSAFETGDLDAAELMLAQLLLDGPATPAAFLAEQTVALRQSKLGRRAADHAGDRPDAVIDILAK